MPGLLPAVPSVPLCQQFLLPRLFRLLFHKVRPVFVFDGATPALKRMTHIARRRRREAQEVVLRKTAEKLLFNQLKKQVGKGKQQVRLSGGGVTRGGMIIGQ